MLGLSVKGNTLVRLVNGDGKTMGSVWFNSAMHSGGKIVFGKMDIDKFHKAKSKDVMDSAKMTIEFETIDENLSGGNNASDGVSSNSFRSKNRKRMIKGAPASQSDRDLHMAVQRGASTIREEKRESKKLPKGDVGAAPIPTAKMSPQGSTATTESAIVPGAKVTNVAKSSTIQSSIAQQQSSPSAQSSSSIQIDFSAPTGPMSEEQRKKEHFRKLRQQKTQEEEEKKAARLSKLASMTEEEREEFLEKEKDAAQHEKSKEKCSQTRCQHTIRKRRKRKEGQRRPWKEEVSDVISFFF